MKKRTDLIPREVAAFLHFGWTLAVILTGACLLGLYIDKKLNIAPAALLVSSVLGIIISGYLFFSTVKKVSQTRQNDKTNLN